MTVLTSYAPLLQQLHGRSCDHRRQHQPIEGSCKLKDGKSGLQTHFTEVYPGKFARTVAAILNKDGGCWPYNWKPGMICFAGQNHDFPTRESAFTVSKVSKKPQFPKSEVLVPHARAEAGAKRSETERNQGDLTTLEMCQEAIQLIGLELPRVGKREITNHPHIKMLQGIFQDKEIHRVTACRGTDRTVAPPCGMHPQEAPLRKMLMLKRTGEIQHEVHWEKWADLSKRQLIRPSHSSFCKRLCPKSCPKGT